MGKAGDSTKLNARIDTLQKELESVKRQLEKQKTTLFDSETLYRTIVESSPDSIVITDLSGKVKYFSPSSLGIFGYPDDFQLKGHSIFDFLEDDEHTKVAKGIEEMFTDNLTGAAEYVGLKADQSNFEIEVNGKLIKDKKGQVVNILFMIRDISKRKRNEKELEESKQISSNMINNLPGLVYRCLNDKLWTMVFMSKGCKELTGYPRDAFIGDKAIPYNNIIYVDDRAHVLKTIEDGLKKGNSFEMKYRIVTSEGEIKKVWEKGWGVVDKDKTFYLEGIIMDISGSIWSES